MHRIGLVILAGCAHHAAVVAVPPPAPARPVANAPKRPAWPFPVRVMTWTADGVKQIGVLPDAPPAEPPATPWYVEPMEQLDRDKLHALVAAVRAEHVPGLSLRGQPVAAWLDQELTALPELHALVLDDTAVSEIALPGLPLERLYVARTPIDDGAIVRAVAAHPELRVLDAEDCAIDDGALDAIAGLGELRALDLAGTRVTDGGGAKLGALSHLEILDLGRTQVAAQTVAAIRPLALRELFLDATKVGKEIAGLDGFAPGLVRFDVSSLQKYQPSDADVAWLARAPNLVEVGLSNAKVHDPLVLAIAALPHVRQLRLAKTPITLASIRAIAKLAALDEVDLADTPVDDAAAQALVALPALRVLRLDHTPITDAGLRATPGPALEELWLSRTNIADAATELLVAAPGLTGLGLGETHIGNDTIARVAKLDKLKTLVLSATRADREVLPQLGGLHDLTRLYLDGTHTDDAVIAALGDLRGLRVLHLAGTDVSDEALATLQGFKRLDELTIGDTRVTSAITDLAAWPRLRTLSLLGLAIHDAELATLARAASLTTLDLSSTDVRDPAAVAALPHLHVLGLAQTRLTAAGNATAAQLARRGVEIVR